MKNVVRIVAALSLVILAGGTVGQEYSEVNIYYFSDRALLNETADFYNYCDGSHYEVGSPDTYRVRETYSCITGGSTHVCQELINGNYQNYTCPSPW